MVKTFNKNKLKKYCDLLAGRDADLKAIINCYGYPPMWKRAPTFETLIHIILEQQVSLSSALAALKKLQGKTGTITPAKILLLTDEDMKACYFSRQKMGYARHLATAVLSGSLPLEQLGALPDEEVRVLLKAIKGIGDWTADVFLMMGLQRCDLFPLGDVALMNSVRDTKFLSKETSRATISIIAAGWKPYRTIAAFLLWHSYLCKRIRPPLLYKPHY